MAARRGDKTELVAPRGSIVIVIRTPIDMRKLSRIMAAIATGFPKSTVQTSPPYSSVQVDAWLLEVGGDDAS
jgi:hypothetical protein